MRTLQELEQLQISVEHGLSAEAVARSRRQFGANRLTPVPRESLWKKFRDKFDEPIIKILLAAALLSMVVELFSRPVLGGIGLALVVAPVAALYVLRISAWVPSAMFGCAVLLSVLGL